MSISETANPSPPNPNTSVPKPPGFSFRNVLLLVVPVAVVLGGVYYWFHLNAQNEENEKPNLSSLKMAVDYPLTLDPRFQDANGDMVADAPTDAKQWIDPETLIFTVLPSSSQKEGKNEADWADFVKHLQSVTGKKVQLVQRNFLHKEQFGLMAKGDGHVMALSTGSVIPAVNLGGFVPVCVMADENGKWGYEMELIVPAKSSVQSIEDLRGKKLAIVNYLSHSGFRLPVVTLREKGMLFERDYQLQFTGEQAAAIQMIKKEECDAAGVASDFLKRQTALGLISANDYRAIFKSAAFPPACFGHAHNLKPELAAQIRRAFLGFDWKDSSLEKAYKDSNQIKFAPVSYKDDWAVVRDVEIQLRKILEEKP